MGKIEKRPIYHGPCTFSSHRSVVSDALAQVLVCGVVGEPSKFVLDGLGKVRVLDD